MSTLKTWGVGVFLSLLILSCQKPIAIPYPVEPAPAQEALARLGQHLFFDPRLSINGSKACATCHDPVFAFTDGYRKSLGLTGDEVKRNAPSLLNARYWRTLNWANPDIHAFEQQVLNPLFKQSPPEMGLTPDNRTVLERLRSLKLYQGLFEAAFPKEKDPFTFFQIRMALGAYQSTLVSFNAPFDRYVRGEAQALSPAAKRGMKLFFSNRLNCITCHPAPYFTDATLTNQYHNVGLYNVDGQGAYPATDQGVYEVTRKPEDMGKFRTPSLRNVMLTAPYFHDGSVARIQEVMAIFSQGGQNKMGKDAGDGRKNPFKSPHIRPFSLSNEETQDLIHFLSALTDTTFLRKPAFKSPFDPARF